MVGGSAAGAGAWISGLVGSGKQVESVLAYAVVADLISDVDCAALDGLPEVQRIALDRVLLRADGGGPPSDHRVVATAHLSILERLAAKSPVLVAIDDVQWVDASSKSVVAFVARRLDRQIGVLVGEGPGPDDGETTASWLRLATQDGIERIRLGPLSLGDCDTFRLLLGFVEERAGKCPAALDIEDLNAPRISAFLDHLERSRGNTVRTRNARLAAIHSLFRFAYLQ